MIEKVIHYIWFGDSSLSELSEKCIASWKKYCPDYKIVKWDEKSFDFDSYPYAKEAYENKGYAFASDLVRLYVLYHYGGVYMDTDIELLKPLDPFLSHAGFTGFETEKTVHTGLIAAEKGNSLIGAMLKTYEGRHFLKKDGKPDFTPITCAVTNVAAQNGLKLDDTYQEISGFAFYPKEWFCPKDYRTAELNVTENTVCIHHYNGAWGNRKLKKFKRFIKRMLGKRLTIYIMNKKQDRRRKKEEKRRLKEVKARSKEEA